jgi:hypothetical protein
MGLDKLWGQPWEVAVSAELGFNSGFPLTSCVTLGKLFIYLFLIVEVVVKFIRKRI